MLGLVLDVEQVVLLVQEHLHGSLREDWELGHQLLGGVGRFSEGGEVETRRDSRSCLEVERRGVELMLLLLLLLRLLQLLLGGWEGPLWGVPGVRGQWGAACGKSS